jgi:hypothetical protein
MDRYAELEAVTRVRTALRAAGGSLALDSLTSRTDAGNGEQAEKPAGGQILR